MSVSIFSAGIVSGITPILFFKFVREIMMIFENVATKTRELSIATAEMSLSKSIELFCFGLYQLIIRLKFLSLKSFETGFLAQNLDRLLNRSFQSQI